MYFILNSHWKIKRTFRNARRLIMVFIVLSILNHLFKGTMILPSFVTIGKWTNTLLTILFYTALVFVGVKVFRHFNKKRKFSRANIYEIDRMTGEQFEHYLGFLFTKLGYKTKVTPYSGDYGADVVLVKDGVTTVVQAKQQLLDNIQCIIRIQKIPLRGIYGISPVSRIWR